LQKKFNQFLIWETLLEELMEDPLEETVFHMKQLERMIITMEWRAAMQELPPSQRPTRSLEDSLN
tara:strand:+ start:665 stop:859 length:195 start_codon:yes stop_codon:yes gene_type:complete